MRLFTAIELESALRDAVAAFSAALRARVDEAAPDARITWVPPDCLHLTVRFIGETDDRTAEGIVAALREPLPLAPFTMRLDAPGVFPAKGPPRVLWLGVGEGRDAAVRAEALVGDRLLALGVPREDRPFSPHLTLARLREPAGLRARRLFDGLAVPAGAMRVDAITLFQSRLSPKGPTYVALEKTGLRP